MNMAVTQQPKLALKRHEAAVIDDDGDRGFISYTVNAYSHEAGINRQLASVIQCGLAIELLEILKPEFPAEKFSVTRYAREMNDFPAEERSSSRVKDLVIWLRDSDEPGKDFLTLIGCRGDSKRLAWFESATGRAHP